MHRGSLHLFLASYSIHNNQKCIAKLFVDLYSCSVTDLKTIVLIELERDYCVCEFELSFGGSFNGFFLQSSNSGSFLTYDYSSLLQMR